MAAATTPGVLMAPPIHTTAWTFLEATRARLGLPQPVSLSDGGAREAGQSAEQRPATGLFIPC